MALQRFAAGRCAASPVFIPASRRSSVRPGSRSNWDARSCGSRTIPATIPPTRTRNGLSPSPSARRSSSALIPLVAPVPAIWPTASPPTPPRRGIKCYVMIPHDLEQGKVLGSLIFGPTMVRIRGNYDDVNRLCTEIADKYGWAIVNVNLRPYYTEGAKTYRLRNRRATRLAPAAAHDHPHRRRHHSPQGLQGLQRIHRAWDWSKDNSPKIYSAQAAGCNPVGDGHSQRHRHHRAPEAQHDRQEHRHRQPGRRLLRLPGGQGKRRLGRERHRSARSSMPSSCWPRPKASGPNPPAAPPWPWL